jgi:hypothetical protein
LGAVYLYCVLIRSVYLCKPQGYVCVL